MKLVTVIILLFNSNLIFSQNWQLLKPSVSIKGTLKNFSSTISSTKIYIDVEKNGDKANAQIRRPFSVSKGAQFVSLTFENKNSGYIYEILPSSSKDKSIKLKPGRYQVILTAKISHYYHPVYGSRKGSYSLEYLRWFGYMD